jgi:hypothetical protein
MSDLELIEKIKRELLKSGFPLELRCRKAIKPEWNISLSRYYFDADKVEHEIDLTAFRQSLANNPSNVTHMLNTNMILECKKNDSNHWIFFTGEFTLPMLNCISNLPENRLDKFEILSLKSLAEHHYKKATLASSYCCAFKADRNQIFEAINQVSSAYNYDVMNVEPRMAKSDYKKEGVWINIFYPIIVFGGKLFTAELIDKEIQVKIAKHIVYNTFHEYRLKLPRTIDVVSEDFFEEYLVRLDKSHVLTEKYFKSLVRKIND